MLELIHQNPLISLILFVAPAIGVIWKIFDALYVKPRDFRIAVLEKTVDKIRKEFQRTPTTATEPYPQTNVASLPAGNSSTTMESQAENLEAAIQGTTLLNDLSEFYKAWQDITFTNIQRDQFEKNYLSQKIVWRVRLGDVTEERDGLLWVSLTSWRDREGGMHVIAVFEPKFKEALLMLRKGEIVTVSGIIDRFSLSPVIKNCVIVRNV